MRRSAAIGVALAVLALWPFTFSPATDAKYLIIGLLPFVLAIQWWLYVRRAEPAPLVIGHAMWILGAFLVINLAAAMLSGHRLYCLTEFAKYLALTLIFFLTAQACRTPEQAWRMLAILCGAIAVTSVYGLVQRAGVDPFPWETRDVEEYRGLPSTYGNPNIAAHTLNLGLLCALGLAARRKTRWCAFFAFVIAAHLYLTEVRAAKVAVPAGLALVLAAELARRRGGSTPHAIMGAVAACGLLAASLLAGVMGYHYVRDGSFAPSGHTFLLRYNSFYGASRMMLDHPLTGFGPGAYWLENPPYWTPYEQAFFATDRKFNHNVHNELLETGVESGFVGACLYIGFLVALLTTALGMTFKSENRDARLLGYTLAACVAAFGVDGLFGFNLRSPASAAVFFALAGVLVGVSAGVRSATTAARAPWPRLALAGAACCAAPMPALFASLAFAAQTLHQEARAAESWKEPAKALELLETAERLAPWDPVSPEDRGRIHAEYGRPREALVAYERARSLNPNWVPIHLGLAQQSFILSQTDEPARREEARAAVDEALALCPTLPEAHFLLGQMALADAWSIAAGDGAAGEQRKTLLRSAIAHCSDALKYGLERPAPVHLTMAQIHTSLGEFKEAERAFSRAAESAPAEESTWTTYEQYATATGNWESYVDSLVNALNLAERNRLIPNIAASEAAWWLAKAYREYLHDDVLARTTLERGLRLAHWDEALWGACIALEGPAADRHDLAQALEKAEAVAGAPSLDSFVRLLRDQFSEQASLRDSEVAASVAERVRVKRASNPEGAARRYGWIMTAFGLLIRTSTEVVEARASALSDLAATALEIGAFAEAESLYSGALELQTGDARQSNMLGRAEALYLTGKKDEALTLVEDAARTWPQSFEVALARARLLARMDRSAEAKLAYRLILSRYGLEPSDRAQVQQELDQLTPEPAP